MRLIRFVAGGCAAFVVGTVAVVGTIGTAITALTGSWWAVAWLVAAVCGTAALVWVVRRLWIIRPRPKRDDETIEQAIAAMPPAARPARSRAALPGLATRLGWTVYAVGLIVGALAGVGGQTTGEGELVALAVVAAAGVGAGILLGLARDSRARRNRLRNVVTVPASIAFVSFFQGGSSDGLGERTVTSGVVLLATGLPLLGGFTVARGIAAFYRAAHPVNLTAQPLATGSQAELERATRQGRSAAVLREYAADADGQALLAEDRHLLEAMGYALSKSGEGYDRLRDERTIQAFFVRKDVRERAPDEGGNGRSP
jgi:hypothetical protein